MGPGQWRRNANLFSFLRTLDNIAADNIKRFVTLAGSTTACGIREGNSVFTVFILLVFQFRCQDKTVTINRAVAVNKLGSIIACAHNRNTTWSSTFLFGILGHFGHIIWGQAEYPGIRSGVRAGPIDRRWTRSPLRKRIGFYRFLGAVPFQGRGNEF